MSSKAQDDELVIGLMQEALALSASARESFVREACGDDGELYRQVWHYVTAEERMQGFLTRPLLERRPALRRLEAGERLEGRFQILRLVAEGGMGLVYEALDEKLGRRIALKFAKPGFRQLLSPEVRSAQEIAHPNVCKIFEIHSMTLDGETVDFVTMELLEGPTLAQRLSEGPLPRAEAQAIAAQICAGLAEAHRQHVVHGDLKSSNIILTKGVGGALRVVITDFGMARALNVGLTPAQAGQVGGTPAYMAPELWQGEKSTMTSDVYALGVLLYELAAGRRPFPAEDSRPPLASLPGAGAPRPQQLPKPAPAYGQWDGILARCLASNPKQRFASAVQVSERLNSISRRRMLAAGGSGAMVALLGWQAFRPEEIPTVAILPFRNAVPGQETQYLSDGVSEGLINTLAQLPEVRVVARSSSFRFASGSADIRQAAQALGAKALVTGRVSTLRNEMAISVELVRSDGTIIWGSEYHPMLGDLPYVQGQISAEIAQRISSRISESQKSRLAKLKHANPEAFALLLRGRFQMQLYAPENTKKAADYFEQALGIDPDFALANMELANTYRRLGGAGILKPAESIVLAGKAVARAIAADGELAEAYAVLADVRKDEWNWAAAEQAYRRALALSPSLAAAHQGFAIFLSVHGKGAEAEAELMRAAELDPISLTNAVDGAAVFYNLRRYDKALEILNTAIRRDATAPAPWTWTGIVRGGKREYGRALEAFGKAAELGDKTAATACYAVHALARSGKAAQAQEMLDTIQRSGDFLPGSSLAIALAGLGQTERTLEVLEAAYAARDPLLQYVGVESHLDALHGEARFRSLLKKLGLPQAS